MCQFFSVQLTGSARHEHTVLLDGLGPPRASDSIATQAYTYTIEISLID